MLTMAGEQAACSVLFLVLSACASPAGPQYEVGFLPERCAEPAMGSSGVRRSVDVDKGGVCPDGSWLSGAQRGNKGTSQRGCQQLKKGSPAWLRVRACVC